MAKDQKAVSGDPTAEKGHKTPVKTPDGRCQVWEPEAFNARLAAHQRERGDARNIPDLRLGNLHVHTDQPVVQRDPGKRPEPPAGQRVAPVAGEDAVIEPLE